MGLFAEVYEDVSRMWEWRIRNRLGRLIAKSADPHPNRKMAVSDVLRINPDINVRVLA